jgi:hypothetical protein
MPPKKRTKPPAKAAAGVTADESDTKLNESGADQGCSADAKRSKIDITIEEKATSVTADVAPSPTPNGDVVVKKRFIFTCGAGEYGQLGHGEDGSQEDTKPRRVRCIISNIVFVVNTGTKSAAQHQNGRCRRHAFHIFDRRRKGTGFGQVGESCRSTCAAPTTMA